MIETVYKFQTLIAGLLALGAAWAIVKEGKRARDFRTKQHEIEIQIKRRAVAVMLTADIQSVAEMANLKSRAEETKEEAEKFEHLDKDESITRPLIPPIYQSFLNNYSHYIENMPLMRGETVEAVSRFYFRATRLSEAIESSNRTMAEKSTNQTKANYLARVSRAAKHAKTQFERTLPLLKEEVKEAQKELDRLEGVKEKLDARAP